MISLHLPGKQEIRSLSVRCDNGNKKSKCKWIGTLGTLHNHLTTCKYTPIPCPKKCADPNGKIKSFMRKELEKHLPYCPNRNFECKFCGEKGTYATIKQVHEEVCEKKIIPCTNTKCSQTMQRLQLNHHVQFECEHTVVICKHKIIGCNVGLERRDMVAHQQNDSLHLHMAIATVTQLKEKMLKNESTTFQLTEYQKKKELDENFTSPSFYTGPSGYHVYVSVNANGCGDGKGTHVSVYLNFIKGKYDAKLKWPFVGEVALTLLNQAQDSGHYTVTMNIISFYNLKVGEGRGYTKYITQAELMSKYLKDDTIYFRMSVEVADHKPWLVCNSTET